MIGQFVYDELPFVLRCSANDVQKVLLTLRRFRHQLSCTHEISHGPKDLLADSLQLGNKLRQQTRQWPAIDVAIHSLECSRLVHVLVFS
jgi:hypothetical protein